MIDEICTADEWGPEKVVLVRDEALGMQGALVIDNTSRGPGKGGTRMRPSLTINEVARLARVMTWKWAAADLRFGGAKAGLRFDPKCADKELALRRFARALASEVPREYMFGLDVGLTEVDAAILQDELGTVDAATGGPSALGGVPYDAWGVTGHGVAASAIQAMAFAGLAVDGARVVVQGFGAVGAATAARLHRLGASIISVSTADGAILDEDGLDVPGPLEAREEMGDGCLATASGATPVAPDAQLRLDCDVLIPAATQDVIGAAEAASIAARVLVEGANLPCTEDAISLLSSRGVTVVPDLIANAGGVIAAAYEIRSRRTGFPVQRDELLADVERRIAANTVQVLTKAEADGSTTHAAGRDLARRRVREAMAARESGRRR